MKFMQRAAAASSPTSPSAPSSDDGHSSKRRKTAGRLSLGDTEAPTYVTDQNATQETLNEEERKRQVAIEKRAEQLGDSHWVLDAAKLPTTNLGGTPLKIVQVGFSQIDSRMGAEEDQVEEEERKTDGPILRSYGPQTKGKKVRTDEKASISTLRSLSAVNNHHANMYLQSGHGSDSESKSGSQSDDSDGSDSSSEESGKEVPQSKPGRATYGAQKRDEIRARRRSAEREKASRQMATKRRKQEVKLNQLTSISGPGGFMKGPQSGGRR